MKVLVGLSGGIDSAATAIMLLEKGFEVEGAIMRIWEDYGEAPSNKNSCYSPNGENIIKAKQVADKIGIKLNVIDCIEDYKKTVLKNFKEEYLSGRTPNPCVWCNSLIKFGALPEFARKMGIEFDKFATGHYATIENKNGRFLLKRAKDLKKDQTYFLYRLNQTQLSQIIMPLGEYSKPEIREYAASKGLIINEKEESQDFYSGDIEKLLEQKEKSGNIVDFDGKILGKHKGIWNYTVGQRRKIGVSAPKPLYVAELRKETNEVVVGFIEDIEKDFLYASNLNWIIPKNKEGGKFEAMAKIRSAQSLRPALIEFESEEKIKVSFKTPETSIAKGQSVVLYEGEYVIGGGIIE